MKTLKFLFFFIFIITLSCSQKGAGTSSVKLNVANLVANGSTTSLNGGVIVFGRSLDDSESFRTAVNTGSQELSLDLKKGDWEFASIAWDGASPMTGNVRCSYTGPITLQNNQVDISFNLKREICRGIVTKKEEIQFSDSAFMKDDGFGSINQFKPIEVISCNVVGSGSCSTANGLTQSYRIFVPGEFKINGNTRLMPGIVSRCISIGSPEDLKLPVGTSDDNFVKYTIEAYSTPGCSGQSIFYPFKEKSPFEGLSGSSIKTTINQDSDKTYIYIEHNPSTYNEYSIGNNAFFGFAKDGDFTPNSSPHFIDTNDYGKVISIDSSNPMKITINTNTHNFQPFDELLWYVNYEKTADGCSPGESDPRKRFTTGMYGIALIKTITPDGADTIIELHKNFNEVKSLTLENRVLNIPPVGNLAVAGNCSIQIVKMRQYRNLTMFNSSTAKITAPVFNTTLEKGGIVAFKVLNDFYVTQTNQYIEVNGKGLPAIANYNLENCSLYGKACAHFGTGGVYRGGGLIFANIKNLKFSYGDNTNFYLKANGDTIAGTTFGGSINMNIKNIYSPNYDLTLQTYAQSFNDSSDGESNIRYCFKDPSIFHNPNYLFDPSKYKFLNVSDFCN